MIYTTVTGEDLEREFPQIYVYGEDGTTVNIEATEHARQAAWQFKYYPETTQSRPMPQYSDIDSEADSGSQEDTDRSDYEDSGEPLLEENIDLQQDQRNVDAPTFRRYRVIYATPEDRKKNTANYVVENTPPTLFKPRRNRPGHLE